MNYCFFRNGVCPGGRSLQDKRGRETWQIAGRAWGSGGKGFKVLAPEWRQVSSCRTGEKFVQFAICFTCFPVKGASYEQFEELVATSHLTPVGKEDIVGGEAERKSLWNPVAVAQQAKQVVGSEVVKNLATAGEQEKEPTTVKEFRDAWANGSENDQLVLLNKLGDDSLQRLFSTDIPVDIFKKIVSLFLKLNGNEELVKNTLLTLSRSSRFSLCLLFMESQDKADVEVLIDRLEKKGLEGIDQLKQIYH